MTWLDEQKSEMKIGWTSGKTAEQQMGTNFYDVGSLHRQEAMRQTSMQTDGLLLEYHRSALVQSCKESKQLENSAERRPVDHKDQDDHLDYI